MFQCTVRTVFSAAHALVMQGAREHLHGHDWHVRVTVEGPTLDEDGLLLDFHPLEEQLDSIRQRFHNRSLNDTSPFDVLNPTAEHVARYIAQQITSVLPEGVRVARVAVDEAPGCTATYIPDA